MRSHQSTRHQGTTPVETAEIQEISRSAAARTEEANAAQMKQFL